MTLQDIRRHFETPVVDTCTALNIPYRPANTLEPNGDAYSEFVEARLQFGAMMEGIVGDCTNLENIRGSFIIEYFGPKGRGPARAQEVMELLFCDMLSLKGVTDINGPNFTELDDRPYYFARMSMAIITNKGIEMTGSGGGSGGGPGGGGGTGTVTTADVGLTNPTRANFSDVETTVITPPPTGAATQEDANTYFVQVIDELDEAAEEQRSYTNIADLDELV